MEHIIYNVFSRANSSHPYVYVFSDIRTDLTGAREGSWDILLIDRDAIGSNIFKPIFIEIKSSVADATKVTQEIATKIDNTVSLLQQSNGIDFILGQLPERVDSSYMRVENPEFVLFISSNDYHPVYQRIICEHQIQGVKERPLILWSYETVNATGHCISIPYANDDHIRNCKNIDRNEQSFTLCRHGANGLNEWLASGGKQNIGVPGAIMPSNKDIVDISVNIIAILSSGKVFNRSMEKLSKADLKDRIRNFFGVYGIAVDESYTEEIISTMEKCHIIIRKNDPLQPFSLSKSVTKKTKKVEDLTNDIVSRVVKNNILLKSETLDVQYP